MIKVNRPTIIPKALKAKKIVNTLESLRKKAARGELITSEDIPSHWSGARDDLFKMHHGKCCFCERKRDKAREPDVEHYRPKCGVTEDQRHPGYWWFAYAWENLLWSCKSCNEDKKLNHFPISGRRARSEGANLAAERPRLLNPAEDDCEQLFLYDWEETQEMLVKMQVKDDQARGITTRDILDLNRLESLRERGTYIQLVLKPIAYGLIAAREHGGLPEKKQECISNLKKTISSESEFSGLARAYFRKFHLSEYFV